MDASIESRPEAILSAYHQVGTFDDSLCQLFYFSLEGKPYRYACLDPHPKHPHLLVSILEDHTIDTPAGVVNTLVVINTHTGYLHPLVS